MTIPTQCTERKAMAKRLAEHLGTTAHYDGVPGCTFTVGQFTIHRDGSISGDEAALATIKPWLADNGFIEAVSETPAEIQEPEDDRPALNVKFPCEAFTVNNLKNLVFTLYSKQTLINCATQNNTLQISEPVIDALKNTELATPTDFEALMQQYEEYNALQGVHFEDGYITIDYGPLASTDTYNAFLVLTQQMLGSAREATRVFPEHIQTENSKYYMRSWLVRLGMGGLAYKGVRHHLLQHLKGHSAFKNDEAAQKHRDKYAAIRKEKREAAQKMEEAV